jgi:hypothetical protein
MVELDEVVAQDARTGGFAANVTGNEWGYNGVLELILEIQDIEGNTQV